MNLLILFFLLFPFFIFVLLFVVLTTDSLFKGHDLPTSKKARNILARIILKHHSHPHNFYDLGCGRGSVVVSIKGSFPSLEVYGVEKNIIRVFFTKLKSMILRRKVKLQYQDMFKVDLKNADVVYTYLWYDLMPILEEKLKKELKKGSIVITNTSNFLNWKPIETYIVHSNKPDFEKMFVYLKK